MSLHLWNGHMVEGVPWLYNQGGSGWINPISAWVWVGGGWQMVYPDPEMPFVQNITVSTTVTPPSWWRNNVDYVDAILLSGGGGGGGFSDFLSGVGGSPGAFGSLTTQSISNTGMPIVIGQGGAGILGSQGHVGGTGGSTTISLADGVHVVQGGSGGVTGGASSSSLNYGGSPGSYAYEGMTATGGAQQTIATDAGYSPGGGGAGAGVANQSGGDGAPGEVWLQWRQNVSS